MRKRENKIIHEHEHVKNVLLWRHSHTAIKGEVTY